MKWHTASFGTTDEIIEKKALEARIAKFWQDFSAQSATIATAFRQQNSQQLEYMINSILKPVRQEMMWEVSRDCIPSSDDLVLTVTAEENFALRPLSKAIMDAAPKVEGWRFSAFKVPLPENSISSNSLVSRDYADATGKLAETSYGCFNITVRSKHFYKDNVVEDWRDVFLLLPVIFGEEVFEKWIDVVLTEPDPAVSRSGFGSLFGRRRRKPEEAASTINKEFMPLAELHSSLAQCVAAKLDKLPVEPCWQRQFASTAVMTAAKPEVVSRISFTTPYPEVIMAYENRYTFHSSNFTRYEEKFAYLKMIGSFIDPDTLKDRYDLEDSLDSQLRARRAGCVTGGGIGNGVSFIDLIISDLPTAVEILRAECKRIALPDESWLVFNDTYWADEWVGMSETSPAPPPRESKCW